MACQKFHKKLIFAAFIFVLAVMPLYLCQAAAMQPPKEKAATKAASKTASQSVKTHPEPSQAEFDARLAGKFAQSGMTDISDNPGFFTVSDKTPVDPTAQDLDEMVRPVLKQLFKDVKLVEEFGEQPPARDGEVVENKLVYVVRQILAEPDVDQLHHELHVNRKWPASPRLGRKPTHGRKEAVMSFSRSSSRRGYSLVIGVNYETQRVTVISYRLGSKYDRLM